MDTIQIYEATKEEQRVIGLGLNEHNSSQVAFSQEPDWIAINRCIKDCDRVVGGIIAYIYCWKILCIDILWVDPEHRNKGYATALMNDAENTAKEIGCRLAHLDTFDFQAKGLYEKLGYTVFGVLEDCPEGHSRYYMSKKLG